MYDSKNPSVLRSQSLLTQALLELMQRKAYNKISITELVEKAELTRKTFYRNFDSKDEILENYMDIVFHEYLTALERLEDLDVSKIILEYFTVCSRHKNFLSLVIDNKLLSIFYLKYQEYLSIIGQRFQNKTEQTSPSLQYHIAFSTGGFFQIIQLWLENSSKESPEEMADICMSFLPPV